jgi:hypothetical protein
MKINPRHIWTYGEQHDLSIVKTNVAADWSRTHFIDIVCGKAVHIGLDFLKIYYNVADLVKKRGTSWVSTWQFAETEDSANVSYNKGAYPILTNS